MFVLYLGLLGLFSFVIGALVLGIWLKKHPTRENAEKSSRITQFLFFAGLGTPFVVWFFYPGLMRLDGLVALPSLPWRPFFLIVGILLMLSGLYLMGSSLRSLRAQGSGANAFRLTRRIVELDIYRYTRNPMSLGYYLFALGVAFATGSTLLTLAVLAGLIPAHLFYLKFFEELELDLRFGDSYRRYRQEVPFLLPRITRG